MVLKEQIRIAGTIEDSRPRNSPARIMIGVIWSDQNGASDLI